MYIPPAEIDRIETAANQLILSAYENERVSLPIDVNRIARAVGLTIREGDFRNPQVSGAFNRAQRAIYIARDEYPQRKVFTIAHEIGHFVLHANKPDEVFLRTDATRFVDPENDAQEAQANWFAASLLMPRDQVVKYAKSIDDLDTLATIFGVSKPAMFFRLKSLGYKGFSLD